MPNLSAADALKLGATNVTAAYYGSTLVWPLASGPLVSDSFDRANASVLGSADTGQPWTNFYNWGITSNKAVFNSSGNEGTAVIDAGVADCTVQATITGANASLCVRSARTVVGTFSEFVATRTEVYRRSGGSWTFVGTFSSAFADGDVQKVVLSGTSHTWYKNGASVLSYTSTFNQTETEHGIRSSGTSTFDDFTITVP